MSCPFEKSTPEESEFSAHSISLRSDTITTFQTASELFTLNFTSEADLVSIFDSKDKKNIVKPASILTRFEFLVSMLRQPSLRKQLLMNNLFGVDTQKSEEFYEREDHNPQSLFAIYDVNF